MKLCEAVDIVGPVSYEELPGWYAAADLFLFPSPSESLGFVLLESMACATPAIALRNSGGPEEIITDGTDGVLTELPNLSREVISLLHNPARLMEFGISAVKRVTGSYTTEHSASELLDIIGNGGPLPDPTCEFA
jgi:glycosyltransferase involved in cell wall biosynthesis